MEYKEAFLDYANRTASAAGKPVVMTGDINTAHNEIDLARPKAEPQRRPASCAKNATGSTKLSSKVISILTAT